MRISLFLFSLLAITFSSCSAQTADKTNVNVQEAKDLIHSSADLVILDVRTDGEVAAGMIDGAIQMNISESDFESKLETLDKEKPVLVYCKSGGRSAKAQSIMQKSGFKTVYNLDGGYTAWSAAE